MRTPAVMGGQPMFDPGIPFVRPKVPALAQLTERLRPSYEAGILTSGPLVRELERLVAARLGVRHVVAVSSCTSGLMLAVQAVAPGVPALLPSFTFSASAHSLAWNGCRPVFAECDPSTFQLDVADAHARMDGVGAILATHIFGAPCRPHQVETLARSVGIPVIFDAAHAFGALCGGRPIGGFGQAEVFSLSPTKPFVAAEGGLVSTDDDDVAEAVRLGRNYGKPGDYDTLFAGLNARMSELHAALALESLVQLDENLACRRAIARRYAEGMSGIPGIACQQVDEGDESTYKDFTIAVDADAYGLTRDALAAFLRAEGVDTRAYFWPPVHRQHAYSNLSFEDLPVTDRVAAGVLSLPIFPDLEPGVVDAIADLLGLGHLRAGDLNRAMST